MKSNFSISFLHLYNLQTSPSFSLQSSNLHISHSFFGLSFSSLILLNSIFQAKQILMSNSKFENFLSPVVYGSSSQENSPFSFSYHFQSHYWDINQDLTVTFCKFINCSNFKHHGGALSVNLIKINIFISNSVFQNCLSYLEGGALFIHFVRNAKLSYLVFEYCKSASRGQALHSHLSGEQSTEYVSVTFSGLSKSLLSSESVSFVQGFQTHYYFNSSMNQKMKGASSSFFSSSFISLNMKFINAFNNTCEMSRNFAISSRMDSVPFSSFSYGNIILNSGGENGVLFIGCINNFMIDNTVFARNEDTPCLIRGVGKMVVTFKQCFFNTSNSLENLCIYLQYDEVDSTYNFSYNEDSVIKYKQSIPFNESNMIFPNISNITKKIPTDKFQQMRSEELFLEPDVSVVNEAYVSILLPILFIFCYILIKKRFTVLRESLSFMTHDRERII